MRLLYMMLLAASSLPALAAAKGANDRPTAPMQDARFALRIDAAPSRSPQRFTLDGEIAPPSANTMVPERFTLRLSSRDKGVGACSAGDALFANGFEN